MRRLRQPNGPRWRRIETDQSWAARGRGQEILSAWRASAQGCRRRRGFTERVPQCGLRTRAIEDDDKRRASGGSVLLETPWPVLSAWNACILSGGW